ncbi:hypothetical protein K461DRAFT_297894 [Myriangium duriaei CBS 260.36]|uniref:Zn(2)-C6 fungal-type domain-containing protein n=1 Tax=Myriangium duriaei CBS 260.36 TaxID=1168546 RepID=A0A9P4MI39_9PEZI|nr:hypothetical protein K461DRAFT_297894 [Myriangium duriaei CBS 260.36]
MTSPSNAISTTKSNKRQRISQACHRCRSKKYKCDGARPSCELCSKSNTTCSYNSVTKRRGLQTGYVKTIEALWGHLFTEVADSERVTRGLLGNLACTLDDEAIVSGTTSSPALQRWKTSGIPAAIESLLAGEGINNIDEARDRSEAELGSFSLDFNSPSRSGWSVSRPISSPLRANLQNIEGAISGDPRSHPAGGNVVPLPVDWHNLAQTYLNTDHTWLPIWERKELYRVASGYRDWQSRPTSISDLRKAEFASLWAVLLLGQMHCAGHEDSRALTFHQTSQSFLSLEHSGTHQHAYARSLLLLTIYHVGRREVLQSRLMLAQAIVLLSNNPTPTAHTLDRLLSSGCLILDTCISFLAGTRPMMPCIDSFDEELPGDEDSADEFEPFISKGSGTDALYSEVIFSRTTSTFKQLVRLLRIMHKFQHDAMLAAELLHDLALWHAQCPSHLQSSDLKRMAPNQIQLQVFCVILRALLDEGEAGRCSPSAATLDHAASASSVASSLVLAEKRYGVEYLPASCSIFVALLHEVRSRPHRSNLLATWEGVENLLSDFSDLWGLTFDQTGPSNSSSSSQALRDPCAPDFQLASHVGLEGMPHPVPVDSAAQSDQQQLSTRGPLESTFDNLLGSEHAASHFEDTTASSIDLVTGSSGPHLNSLGTMDIESLSTDLNATVTTPDELRDYFMLSERRQSDEADRNFLQSLGFLNNSDTLFEDF